MPLAGDWDTLIITGFIVAFVKEIAVGRMTTDSPDPFDGSEYSFRVPHTYKEAIAECDWIYDIALYPVLSFAMQHVLAVSWVTSEAASWLSEHI